MSLELDVPRLWRGNWLEVWALESEISWFHCLTSYATLRMFLNHFVPQFLGLQHGNNNISNSLLTGKT